MVQPPDGREADAGVTSVEYALIALLITVAISAAVAFLGGALSHTYRQTGNAFTYSATS